MALIPPEEAARRARAAIAYAGLTNLDASERAGLTLGTLNNIVSQARPSGGTLDNLLLIADACKVPRSFMEHGWSRDGLEERLTQLEDQVAALQREVTPRDAEKRALDAGRRQAERTHAPRPTGRTAKGARKPGSRDS